MEQGIDVSRYQGDIDWAQAAAAGIRFAVVRAGYGRLESQRDPYFEKNMEGAAAAGLTVGCYWFSYAASAADARAEAEACLAVLAGRRPPLGVWFDQEYVPAILALDNAERTATVQAFLETVRQAGCTAGLYCSADWLKNKLETEKFAGENLWVAQYADALDAPLRANLWQYTGSGSAAGVAGQVDRDVLYEMPRGAEKALHAAGKRQAAGPGPATLRRGSQDAAVCALQSELGCLGYACGAADGIYGAKTDAAVRAFQKSAGLRADGAVGKKTRAALAARLGAAKK
jgi:GH25 family lysozyme M1 (1,4-beta-N-acetylmuramidase)